MRIQWVTFCNASDAKDVSRNCEIVFVDFEVGKIDFGSKRASLWVWMLLRKKRRVTLPRQLTSEELKDTSALESIWGSDPSLMTPIAIVDCE